MDRGMGLLGPRPRLVEPEAIARRSTDVLKRVVEQHIVPRLVLSHPHVVSAAAEAERVAGRIADITELALSSDDDGVRRVLTELKQRGASHDALQLGLLAPAAERLGRLWSEDRIDFVDVTIATNSLIRSMRFVSLELDRLPRAEQGGAAILIAAAPGETHGFGAAMAAEFFRRGGWTVSHLPEPSQEELIAAVAATSFDVVGLSLSHDRGLARLAQAIAEMRCHARNPALVVIVGGPVFAADPGLVARVGADAAIAAVDIASAEARKVVARRKRGR